MESQESASGQSCGQAGSRGGSLGPSVTSELEYDLDKILRSQMDTSCVHEERDKGLSEIVKLVPSNTNNINNTNNTSITTG